MKLALVLCYLVEGSDPVADELDGGGVFPNRASPGIPKTATTG